MWSQSSTVSKSGDWNWKKNALMLYTNVEFVGWSEAIGALKMILWSSQKIETFKAHKNNEVPELKFRLLTDLAFLVDIATDFNALNCKLRPPNMVINLRFSTCSWNQTSVVNMSSWSTVVRWFQTPERKRMLPRGHLLLFSLLNLFENISEIWEISKTLLGLRVNRINFKCWGIYLMSIHKTPHTQF